MLNLESSTNPFDSLLAFVKALVSPSTSEVKPVADAVRHGWEENFTGEHSGSGAAWAQLTPYTVLERVKRGYPGAHPILVQSGALRSSLLIQGASNSVEQLTTDSGGWTLVLGTTDSKALKHELGEGRVPARPFMEISQAAQDGVEAAIGAMVAQIEARVLK